MAHGKVAEWIRRHTMPRKPAAKRHSSTSGASEPILPSKAAPGTWSSAAAGVLAPTPRSTAVVAAPYRRIPSPGRAPSSCASMWRPRVNVVAVLCEHVVYHMMWLVESVVLVGRLCFFLLRFGFKQL